MQWAAPCRPDAKASNNGGSEGVFKPSCTFNHLEETTAYTFKGSKMRLDGANQMLLPVSTAHANECSQSH